MYVCICMIVKKPLVMKECKLHYFRNISELHWILKSILWGSVFLLRTSFWGMTKLSQSFLPTCFKGEQGICCTCKLWAGGVFMPLWGYLFSITAYIHPSSWFGEGDCLVCQLLDKFRMLIVLLNNIHFY